METSIGRTASGNDAYSQGYRKGQELIANPYSLSTVGMGRAIDNYKQRTKNKRTRDRWTTGYVAAHVDELHMRALAEHAERTMPSMFRALFAHSDLVPDGFMIEPHMRFDRVLNIYHRCVHVRPESVDPETFNFGTPGAYATIVAVSDGDAWVGYQVHVFTTSVAWTVQKHGHAVAFTDADEAVRTAVLSVQPSY